MDNPEQAVKDVAKQTKALREGSQRTSFQTQTGFSQREIDRRKALAGAGYKTTAGNKIMQVMSYAKARQTMIRGTAQSETTVRMRDHTKATEQFRLIRYGVALMSITATAYIVLNHLLPIYVIHKEKNRRFELRHQRHMEAVAARQLAASNNAAVASAADAAETKV